MTLVCLEGMGGEKVLVMSSIRVQRERGRERGEGGQGQMEDWSWRAVISLQEAATCEANFSPKLGCRLKIFAAINQTEAQSVASEAFARIDLICVLIIISGACS